MCIIINPLVSFRIQNSTKLAMQKTSIDKPQNNILAARSMSRI